MAKIEQKLKANPLPFWSILAFFKFLKTVQKQRLHASELFSSTPNVFLGLFELFSKCWKYGKNWAKSKS